MTLGSQQAAPSSGIPHASQLGAGLCCNTLQAPAASTDSGVLARCRAGVRGQQPLRSQLGDAGRGRRHLRHSAQPAPAGEFPSAAAAAAAARNPPPPPLHPCPCAAMSLCHVPCPCAAMCFLTHCASSCAAHCLWPAGPASGCRSRRRTHACRAVPAQRHADTIGTNPHAHVFQPEQVALHNTSVTSNLAAMGGGVSLSYQVRLAFLLCFLVCFHVCFALSRMADKWRIKLVSCGCCMAAWLATAQPRIRRLGLTREVHATCSREQVSLLVNASTVGNNTANSSTVLQVHVAMGSRARHAARHTAHGTARHGARHTHGTQHGWQPAPSAARATQGRQPYSVHDTHMAHYTHGRQPYTAHDTCLPVTPAGSARLFAVTGRQRGDIQQPQPQHGGRHPGKIVHCMRTIRRWRSSFPVPGCRL